MAFSTSVGTLAGAFFGTAVVLAAGNPTATAGVAKAGVTIASASGFISVVTAENGWQATGRIACLAGSVAASFYLPRLLGPGAGAAGGGGPRPVPEGPGGGGPRPVVVEEPGPVPTPADTLGPDPTPTGDHLPRLNEGGGSKGSGASKGPGGNPPESSQPKQGNTNTGASNKGGPYIRRLRLESVDEQAQFLSENVPGLTQEQANLLLVEAQKRGSSVVIGGSRIRGNFRPDSDLDVGYGSLSKAQAQKLNAKATELGPLKIDRTPIVPGHESNSIPKITTPEEFFQRGGVRGPGDPKAGQPYLPSGSITVTPYGEVIITPPGANPL